LGGVCQRSFLTLESLMEMAVARLGAGGGSLDDGGERLVGLLAIRRGGGGC
jgi:hypothetical protein